MLIHYSRFRVHQSLLNHITFDLLGFVDIFQNRAPSQRFACLQTIELNLGRILLLESFAFGVGFQSFKCKISSQFIVISSILISVVDLFFTDSFELAEAFFGDMVDLAPLESSKHSVEVHFTEALLD